jgi:hypothetical protein
MGSWAVDDVGFTLGSRSGVHDAPVDRRSVGRSGATDYAPKRALRGVRRASGPSKPGLVPCRHKVGVGSPCGQGRWRSGSAGCGSQEVAALGW